MHIFTESIKERELLTAAVEASAQDGIVRVLEAGCGNRWSLAPKNVKLHITGIDTDAEALRIRREVSGDLDEAIVADLRDAEVPVGRFDVVYCSYVLEHVEGAEDVLNRLLDAVRPGGRLIVRMPDRDSVFGWTARHTPHRTHVWFKRYVERFPDAGKPGHAPYPVVYDKVVSARGMQDWVRRRGATVETAYATNYFLKLFRFAAPAAQAAFRLVARLSGRRLTAEWNNIGYVVIA